MLVLALGLLLFLATHSVRIVADDWRAAQIARLGIGRWKILYSVVAAIGLALVVYGFGLARAAPVVLWEPPTWTRHLTALLTLPAFVLVAAAYAPPNRIRAAVGHPMVAGVKLWAFGHLLSNGRLDEILLFGAFLVWAIFDFRAARRRDRAEGVVRAAGGPGGTAAAVILGVIAWWVFAVFLHRWVTGVQPFG